MDAPHCNAVDVHKLARFSCGSVVSDMMHCRGVGDALFIVTCSQTPVVYGSMLCGSHFQTDRALLLNALPCFHILRKRFVSTDMMTLSFEFLLLFISVSHSFIQ